MSPYSWLAAERIDDLLPNASWRPVAGAAIHTASGRVSWGRTDERASNVAECERRARERGLGRINWPSTWPSDGRPAARALTFAARSGNVRSLALSVMRIGFLEGRNITEREVIGLAAARAGLEASVLLAAVDSPTVERELAAVTDEALALGVYGMPTVVIGGELFWGDDRLGRAVARSAEASAGVTSQ
jgi:2-hydroxychromene-2-carboxylate isomerase